MRAPFIIITSSGGGGGGGGQRGRPARRAANTCWPALRLRPRAAPVFVCVAISLYVISLAAGERAPVGSAALEPEPEARSLAGHNGPASQTVVSHKSTLNGRQFGDSISDIHIECNSDHIAVTLTTHQGFNGMIYPKGLSKNSSCMSEYHQLTANITYLLPLKSCNTMSADVDDGVEYFNTLMVQPHRRLVTNQGRGYHIRCRYQTKERTITNQDQQLSVNLSQTTPAVLGAASMPGCTMRIYAANDLSREVVAENVRIGDELQLVIALDEQDVYGMLVTNCLVRDGMNWGEQPLLDDNGCPVDEDIMAQFQYAPNLTRASVTFQAHKFPYTSSVYYQCNVRLCFRDGGCSHVPPSCNSLGARFGAGYNGASPPAGNSAAANELAPGAGAGAGAAPIRHHQQQQQQRHKRWLDAGELEAVAAAPVEADAGARWPAAPRDLSVEVSSGLHVDESALEPDSGASAPSSDGDPLVAAAATSDESVRSSGHNDDAQSQPAGAAAATKRGQSERDFCMSLRKFAIAISLASLLLMLAIIIMLACMIQRRNRLKALERQQAEREARASCAPPAHRRHSPHGPLAYGNGGYNYRD